MRNGWLVTLFFTSCFACGTSPAPPSASPEPGGATSPAPGTSSNPTPSATSAPGTGKPEARAAGSAANEKPEAPPSAEPVSAKPEERDVKYVMAGGKLEMVHIGGVHFKPSAKAIRTGGGWGVKLTVSAEAEDDKTHSLLGSKNSSLSFAGKVTRKGKPEDLGDQREGGEEVVVAPGEAVKLEREWPGKSGAKPLGAGDKLELHVGLWGFGPDAASRKPVKKFLLLTMTVGQGEPRPLVAPPQ